ncbi:hypothetical protein [Limnoglobus roseus]|uniref:Uncharacterized protein n=1 Tax=Limnoglobus roseus TaxID=2598579 RepID=A0A5C1AM07_9BACT|nr:hypothetical protein [Limnoglobus roseus]QEL20439.1 hypothetical protein PX52LOC_07537 [Limnoglobus roseus]
MTPDQLTRRAAACVEQLLTFVTANGFGPAVHAQLTFHLSDAGGAFVVPFTVTPAAAATPGETPVARSVSAAAFLGATAGRIQELCCVAACRPPLLLNPNGLNDDLDLEHLAPVDVAAVELATGFAGDDGPSGSQVDRWHWQTGEAFTQPAVC